MISEQDVSILKEGFKDTFATKEDIKALSAIFATKEEHRALEVKVDGVIEMVGSMNTQMGEMNQKMDSVLTKLDTYIDRV